MDCRLLLIVFTLFFSLPQLVAQEITLVTTGEGETKHEAVTDALRSAIEQSFTTFVSANTSILNDELVKDNAVTVTSGNIKSYKELSCVKTSGGFYEATVSSTVSIGELIKFAKSHGSSTEFAGNTFAMNIKMWELNKKNEKTALEHLLVQLSNMKNEIFNFDINTYEPEKGYDDNFYVQTAVRVITNQNYVTFFDILTNTLSALSVSEGERNLMAKNNIHCKTLILEGFDYNSQTKIFSNKRFFLRNDISVISDFTKRVVDILNDAQISFVVIEKGHTNLKKYPTLNKMQRFFRPDPQTISLFRDDRIPRGINKIVSIFDLYFKFSLEEISKVTGFEVKKYPISERKK